MPISALMMQAIRNGAAAAATPAPAATLTWITLGNTLAANPTLTNPPAGTFTYANPGDTYTGSAIAGRGGLIFGASASAPPASNTDGGGGMGLWYISTPNAEYFVVHVGAGARTIYLAIGNNGAPTLASSFKIQEGAGAGGAVHYDSGLIAAAGSAGSHVDAAGNVRSFATFFANQVGIPITTASGIITIQRGASSDFWLDGVGWI
jgi:hypothetical protein